MVFTSTHPAQKISTVGHHGLKDNGGKIMLTYASMRGEEEELSDKGETFKVQRSNLVRTYSHWILRDLICHHIRKKMHPSPFYLTPEPEDLRGVLESKCRL